MKVYGFICVKTSLSLWFHYLINLIALSWLSHVSHILSLVCLSYDVDYAVQLF